VGDGRMVAENMAQSHEEFEQEVHARGRCGTRTCYYSRATNGRHSCNCVDHGLHDTQQPVGAAAR